MGLRGISAVLWVLFVGWGSTLVAGDWASATHSSLTAQRPILLAQNAAPADRNAVNTAARPGDMMADSPVKFPATGALPAKYAPDVKTESEPVEKDYYLFSSPCRSLQQIATIQQDMPKGKFTPPPHAWNMLPRTHRILTSSLHTC
jgi:hypothetical protein